MAKTNKAQRRNEFLMGGMQQRAMQHVRAYLSKNAISCAPADDADFKNMMDSVTKAMLAMYQAAVCDTCDVEDGRPLEEVRS